jgi:hypothetical protein
MSTITTRSRTIRKRKGKGNNVIYSGDGKRILCEDK